MATGHPTGGAAKHHSPAVYRYKELSVGGHTLSSVRERIRHKPDVVEIPGKDSRTHDK
jgi:hypothetical protein